MTEQNRLEKWLDQALELETRGYDFYSQAARAASNSQVRDFFQYLADQELVHVKVIKDIYHKLDGVVCWNESGQSQSSKSDLDALFLKMTQNGPSDDADLLKAIDNGIAFETEVRDLYFRQIDQAGCEGEKKFLQLMVGEETFHCQALTDLKLYYTDPVGWAAQMDHGHLDGA